MACPGWGWSPGAQHGVWGGSYCRQGMAVWPWVSSEVLPTGGDAQGLEKGVEFLRQRERGAEKDVPPDGTGGKGVEA